MAPQAGEAVQPRGLGRLRLVYGLDAIENLADIAPRKFALP
jgi:hypothetical protein